MPDLDLPGWLCAWCHLQLGAAPAAVLHATSQQSEVFGLLLDDGRAVAVKRRPDPDRRVAACLRAQAAAAAAGVACPRPLASTHEDGIAVHAEQWWPHGALRIGDDLEHAADSGSQYAVVCAALAQLGGPGALPNPSWVRWDRPLPGPDGSDGSDGPDGPDDDVLAELGGMRARCATRLRELTAQVGTSTDAAVHLDWESQNLRWSGRRLVAVHDWDSVGFAAVAFAAGCASSGFASSGAPDVASLAASAAFLNAFETGYPRRFTAAERQLAWAASLVTPLHNAVEELRRGRTPISCRKVLAQAGQRLRQAGG